MSIHVSFQPKTEKICAGVYYFSLPRNKVLKEKHYNTPYNTDRRNATHLSQRILEEFKWERGP